VRVQPEHPLNASKGVYLIKFLKGWGFFFVVVAGTQFFVDPELLSHNPAVCVRARRCRSRRGGAIVVAVTCTIVVVTTAEGTSCAATTLTLVVLVATAVVVLTLAVTVL
jgi:hypothetical protein